VLKHPPFHWHLGAFGAAVTGSEGRELIDKQSDKAGSLATSELSSNFSAIVKSRIEASVSTQRNDNDVRLRDEGRQRSIDENVTVSATSADHEKLQLTAEIRQLSQRDREVRSHERIHASIAGTPSFQFQGGPNGVLYAVSGSVSIDLSVVPGNAEATVRKAEQAVAAKARSLADQARVELSNNSEVHSGEDASAVGAKVELDATACNDQRLTNDNYRSGTREESAIIGLG
jgi:hypothetical protein